MSIFELTADVFYPGNLSHFWFEAVSAWNKAINGSSSWKALQKLLFLEISCAGAEVFQLAWTCLCLKGKHDVCKCKIAMFGLRRCSIWWQQRCTRSCWWIPEPLFVPAWRDRLVDHDSNDSWVVTQYLVCRSVIAELMRIKFALFAIHPNSWASL